MASPFPSNSDRVEHEIARWVDLWGLPGLGQRLRVVFSSRFRTSLGRCFPSTGEVRLASFLLEGPDDLLREALCHEVAHAAVYEKFRRRVKPHGEEWRALMRAAGYQPRVRIPADELVRRGCRSRNVSLWEHRCPVCQTRRLARTRVSRWRCAACRHVGLEGQLEVVQLAPQAGERV